jgi:hypothetical protein
LTQNFLFDHKPNKNLDLTRKQPKNKTKKKDRLNTKKNTKTAKSLNKTDQILEKIKNTKT